MKKFKKLIPAFCMLLVSAVMLGSSTFAWFSMNNKVTASGLDVTAKSNTQFLMITGSLTGGKVVDTADLATAALTKTSGASDNKVLPVSLFNADTEWYNKENTADKKHKYDDGNTAVAGDWFTANSPKYDAATGTGSVITKVNKVSGDALNNYVLTYKCYIALAKGSDNLSTRINAKVLTNNDDTSPLASAIKVAMTITQNGGTAVTPVVVASTGTEFGTTDSKFNLTATDAETQSYVEVVMYVYIDGFDSTINSKDFTAITGKIKVEFTAVDM